MDGGKKNGSIGSRSKKHRRDRSASTSKQQDNTRLHPDRANIDGVFNQLLVISSTHVIKINPKKVGVGAFGEVFCGLDEVSNQVVAVKVEPRNSKVLLLAHEYRVYKDLGNMVGTPKVFYYGPSDEFNVLVLELLGPNLETLFRHCGRRFSLKTVLTIAFQALDRLEGVHSHFYIYRDVKPQNFLIGRTPDLEKFVYLIDFGLSKQYVDPRTKEHIKFVTGKSYTGTARYMSTNIHNGFEHSRRDDLESLGYVLVYFLKGQLPWQGITEGNKKERLKKIGEKKISTEIDEICADVPEEFHHYLEYCRNLRFEETPDYRYLHGLFQKLFDERGFVADGELDWCRKGAPTSPLGTSTVSMDLMASNFSNFVSRDK